MVTFDLLALHVDLEAERAKLGWPKRAMADTIGVATSTIDRMEDGRPMEADGVLAMVRWLRVFPEHFVIPAPGGGALLSPSAPMVRADTKAMHRALERRRADTELSWRTVAEVLGVSAAELARLKRGGRTTIATLVASAVWLGVPIAQLTHETEW